MTERVDQRFSPDPVGLIAHDRVQRVRRTLSAIQRLRHHFASGLTLGNGVVNDLQAKNQAMQALQERVVQISRDAFALHHALFEAQTDCTR